MKRKASSIVNLIFQVWFLLSCLIPFCKEIMYKSSRVPAYNSHLNFYYITDAVDTVNVDYHNLFTSFGKALSFIIFILLMLCFVGVILLHATDIANTSISFLANTKVILWKNRLRYALPCAEIILFSACLLINDYRWKDISDTLYVIYEVTSLAVIPVLLLLSALCVTEFTHRNTQPGKLTEKKAIAGFFLRVIGLLGILTGTIIHISVDFDIGGFFYIGGAFFYLVGRFLSGIPAEGMPAAPAVEDETASTQTESEAIEVPASQDAPQAAETSKDNGADEIRKYKALLDDGIITQEEFDAKKKQILRL